MHDWISFHRKHTVVNIHTPIISSSSVCYVSLGLESILLSPSRRTIINSLMNLYNSFLRYSGRLDTKSIGETTCDPEDREDWIGQSMAFRQRVMQMIEEMDRSVMELTSQLQVRYIMGTSNFHHYQHVSSPASCLNSVHRLCKSRRTATRKWSAP